MTLPGAIVAQNDGSSCSNSFPSRPWFTVLTWFTLNSLRARVSIYDDPDRDGHVTVEVQNWSASWAIRVEGIRIRTPGGAWRVIPPELFATRSRIQPHDACFVTIEPATFPGVDANQPLEAKADVKTKKTPV